jgi:hypothetical protein
MPAAMSPYPTVVSVEMLQYLGSPRGAVKGDAEGKIHRVGPNLSARCKTPIVISPQTAGLTSKFWANPVNFRFGACENNGYGSVATPWQTHMQDPQIPRPHGRAPPSTGT